MTQQKFNLEISITVRSVQDGRVDYTNTLRVQEEVSVLTASGFMEVAKVLGQFHDLSEKLRQETIDNTQGVAG